MLHLRLANARQRQELQHDTGPLEVGRGPVRSLPRLIVEDRYVSRDQLVLQEISPGTVQLTNLGAPLMLDNGVTMTTGDSREVTLPVRLSFGYTTLDVASQEAESEVPSLLRTVARLDATQHFEDRKPIPLEQAPSPEMLALWFERLLSVQRAAAGSGEFYGETARAVVEMVGLDRGAVLLRRSGRWEIAASHAARPELHHDVSQRVLAEVVRKRRTFFEAFDEQALSQSLVGVEAVVASPIFAADDQVVGILYGTRDLRNAGLRVGIHPLEAQIVQVLAGAVSAGLARLEREAEATRTRVQFEQFFSAELAQALQRDPSLLEGQDRELTIMFCDLRGFSKIAERVGAKQTYALLSDSMDRLTNRIMEFGGVIIDYYGDGLAAMWNAPTDQPDHVQRACRAAMEMQEELPALNHQWESKLGSQLQLGIGIHTGPAQVGNAGSRRRLKYGPRGHTVNLASRVEGATKLLGISCLMTASTESRLEPSFQRRRLCQARVPGIEETVALFEMVGTAPSAQWCHLKQQYEQALQHYEHGRFPECLMLCAQIASTVGTSDRATMLLAQKASAGLATPGPFDPVYELNTKA